MGEGSHYTDSATRRQALERGIPSHGTDDHRSLLDLATLRVVSVATMSVEVLWK